MYFKLDIQRLYDSPQQVIGHANGEWVPNRKDYFPRIAKGEILKDAPVFDYFFLESYGKKKDWEWKLQDAHGFIGKTPRLGCWYISDRFKNLLEHFSISKDYHFYETRLLYKGDKIKYWIFHYSINPWQNMVFDKSIWLIKGEDDIIEKVSTYEQFSAVRSNYYLDLKKDLELKKAVFNYSFDFINNITEAHLLVSKRLKNAIEDAGLEGLEFSELNYTVEIF